LQFRAPIDFPTFPFEARNAAGKRRMAGLPPNKYDLLPYSTTLSPPSSTLNFSLHRSKRELESSDIEDLSSPPRKHRKIQEWEHDPGSSDREEDDMQRISSQNNPLRSTNFQPNLKVSMDNSLGAFHRILSVAVMDGLDYVDFSYVLQVFLIIGDWD
jgi:hypothetical protein